MLYNEKKQFSTAAVKAAKNAISELIEGAGYLKSLFIVMKDAASKNGCPLNPQTMQECEEMFSVIQRLLYQEEANLKYLQHQRIAEERAAREIEAHTAAAKKMKKEPVLFAEAV